MKKLEVGALKLDGKIKTIETIFDNMHVHAHGAGQAGYMLGGDTGVGKTSFVKDMAELLGMAMIIIETPHIIEEHLIDIPFIVIRGGVVGKTDHVRVDTKGAQHEFDIKFAKSHLFTSLQAATKTPDNVLLQNVYERPDLSMIWEKLGGSKTKIPDEIVQLRGTFDVILFLDEYFRQTSSAIRNMLRSILNGRIGSNDLPENVYVIFASNLVDQGVGDILENEDFRFLNFDTPDLDGWFAYILTKYKDKMDDELIARFYALMKKNKGSLSTDDIAADVRVSPRRWEQLLVYINANLPVKDQAAADLLLKNVEINFKNYIDGTKAEIAKDVIDSVTELIKERTKISGKADNVDNADWRDTLKHQLETRIKAGSSRKYIPVIAGSPGIGKTKYIAEIAADLELVPVVIDVQNLSPEEAIGTPLAETDKDEGGKKGDIRVKFSMPALFNYIQDEIEKGTAHLKARFVKFSGEDKGEAKFEEWKDRKVKYLIFFDELNRTSSKVFNVIRKVLLEKEFNDQYKLPKEAIVVAAINPTGKGTIELTKHVRDVFDVIPAGISWPKFIKHLETSVVEKLEYIKPKEGIAMAMNAMKAFAEHFRVRGADRIGDNDPHFYINIGSTPVFISPREYTEMFKGIAQGAARAYRKEMDFLADPDHDAGKSEERVRAAIGEQVRHTVEHVISNKNGLDLAGFYDDLQEWFLHTDKIDMGNLFKKKVASVLKLSDLLTRSFENQDEHLFNEQEFVNYVLTVDAMEFQEQFIEFLSETVIKDFDKAFHPFGKQKVLDKKGKVSVVDKEVTQLEYVVREIIHALKLHDVSNKMMEGVTRGMQNALMQITKHNSDMIPQVMKLARDTKAYIKTLT